MFSKMRSMRHALLTQAFINQKREEVKMKIIIIGIGCLYLLLQEERKSGNIGD